MPTEVKFMQQRRTDNGWSYTGKIIPVALDPKYPSQVVEREDLGPEGIVVQLSETNYADRIQAAGTIAFGRTFADALMSWHQTISLAPPSKIAFGDFGHIPLEPTNKDIRWLASLILKP